MLRFAHIINVTEITESNRKSYLHVAQPVTIKSMIVAMRMAKKRVDVELWAVKHKSENLDIPSEFRWTEPIEKYAYEHIEALRNIVPHKPLPRMVDILLRLYKSSDAEYFIYTNIDIGLYPDFYIKIGDLILNEYDALCINRRDLPKRFRSVLLDDQNLELSFIADGKKHPGIDCFVFRRKIVPLLNLGNTYIGFPPVGQVMKTQVELNSNKFFWVKDQKYTFHLGSDKNWKKQQGKYATENKKQADGLYVPSLGVSLKPPLMVRIKNKIRYWLRYLIQVLE